jgi:integrase
LHVIGEPAGSRVFANVRYGAEFKKLAKLSKVKGFVLHDIRRTVASGLQGVGIAPHVIERVLNHKTGGIQRVYQRHEYGKEKREALDRWAEHIARLLGEGNGASNVVSLRSA